MLDQQNEASNQLIEIWTAVLDYVLFPIPHIIRQQVLNASLEKERTTDPYRVYRASELPGDCKNYFEEREAISLLVQILTRAITSNFSSADAAKILFRDHSGRGTGSGWLPDYLEHLPGITVDMTRCAAIAECSGASGLEPLHAQLLQKYLKAEEGT